MQYTIRVFVSSTWRDLQPERKSVEDALQRMLETKFVGMEYFGSDPENTQRTSISGVNDCDLYIGIFGGRYGSGITEDEYRSARKINLPCFIFFKREEAITDDKRESDPDKSKKLEDLKEELQRHHTVAEFSSPDELAAKVIADISRWIIDRIPDVRGSVASVKKMPRRVDAVVPSRASLGQRVDLLVQVRFPDSRLLGLEEWPLKRKPSSIEQASESTELGFPVNPSTGEVGNAQLEVRVVAPDFKIEGAANKILIVPPNDLSKILTFLITPLRVGYCRIDVEIYDVGLSCLGTVPIEAEVGSAAVATAPAFSVANLYFVVAAQPPQIGAGGHLEKPRPTTHPEPPSQASPEPGFQVTGPPARSFPSLESEVTYPSSPKSGVPWLKLISTAAVLLISITVISSFLFLQKSSTNRTPTNTSAFALAVGGRVIDENGLPIEGALVWIEGYKQDATTTDINGKYLITVPQAVLQSENRIVSLRAEKLGFEPGTASVEAGKTVAITLKRLNPAGRQPTRPYR